MPICVLWETLGGKQIHSQWPALTPDQIPPDHVHACAHLRTSAHTCARAPVSQLNAVLWCCLWRPCQACPSLSLCRHTEIDPVGFNPHTPALFQSDRQLQPSVRDEVRDWVTPPPPNCYPESAKVTAKAVAGLCSFLTICSSQGHRKTRGEKNYKNTALWDCALLPEFCLVPVNPKLLSEVLHISKRYIP